MRTTLVFNAKGGVTARDGLMGPRIYRGLYAERPEAVCTEAAYRTANKEAAA